MGTRGLLPPGCIRDIADVAHVLNQWYEQLKMGISAGDLRIFKGNDAIFVFNGDTWEVKEVTEEDNSKSLTVINKKIVWNDVGTDIYIGTVTHTGESVKVEPCDKITFVGATVSQDGAEGNHDALVTIGSGWPGAPNDLQCSVWVDTGTRGVADKIYTLDSGDWRGRHILIMASFYNGTEANALINCWTPLDARASCMGKNIAANCDLIAEPGGDPDWSVYVDDADGGKLKLERSAGGPDPNEVQVWVTAMATDQRIEADKDVPD